MSRLLDRLYPGRNSDDPIIRLLHYRMVEDTILIAVALIAAVLTLAMVLPKP